MSEDIFTNDSDELEGLINPRLSSEEIVSNLDDHASKCLIMITIQLGVKPSTLEYMYCFN